MSIRLLNYKVLLIALISILVFKGGDLTQEIHTIGKYLKHFASVATDKSW